MPKKAGLKLHGVKFEDALKRMLKTPPPPDSRKSKIKKSPVTKR